MPATPTNIRSERSNSPTSTRKTERTSSTNHASIGRMPNAITALAAAILRPFVAAIATPLPGRILRGDLAQEGARGLHLARLFRREVAEADPLDAPAAVRLAGGDARRLRVGVRLADHGAPLVVAMDEED